MNNHMNNRTNSMNNRMKPFRLAPLFLLAAFFAGLLEAATITVNTSGTTVILSGTLQEDDLVSSGQFGTAATGNSVELQTSGTLTGSVIGDVDIAGSGFDRLKMNGDSWLFSGTAALMGASPATLHVATGTLIVTGAVIAENIAPGATGVTIDSGALLKIGNNNAAGSLVSGSGGAFGIVNDGVLWLARTGNYTFANDVSGSGRIELNYGNVTLTGANTHTGGVSVNSNNLYIGDSTALGSGTLTILNGASLWVTSTESRNVTINNPVVTVGNGRIIINMADGNDVFAFGPDAGTGYSPTALFIMQKGSIHLSGDTERALAGILSYRLDRGANVFIDAGEHEYRKMDTSTNGEPLGTPINFSFEADFSSASGPVLSHAIVDGFSVVANTLMNIRIHTNAPVVAPNFTIPSAGTNLLTADDFAGNTVYTGTLLSLASGSTIAAASLAYIKYQNLYDGVAAGAARRVAITQSADTTGNLLYDYFITTDANGIYLNYGLAALETLQGKTLTLSGDVTGAGANEWNLPITGNGSLNIQATNSILLSNPLGDFSGAATITSGTLVMTGILGTGTLTINPGATLQIGGGADPNPANGDVTPHAGDEIINNGTLIFRLGAPTSANMETITSNISGTGSLTVNNGRVKLSGSNTFTGGYTLGYTEGYIGNTYSLGLGTVTLNNATSLWVLPDEDGDQVWTQPLYAVGSGRVIVRMKNATDVFSFQNGIATSGTGTGVSFIMQNGTYLFDSNAAAVLAGRQIRMDYGATLKIAPGDQAFKSINFSNNINAPAVSSQILSFDADFSNPGAPVLSHLILDAITVGVPLDVRFDSSSPLGSITAPSTPLGSNILTMDDAASNVFTGTLFSFATPAGSLSAANLGNIRLDQQIYVNGTASDTLSSGGDFVQGGDAVGSLLYGYNLGVDSKGIYLNAGLAGIEIFEGKTLALSGDITDSPGANELSMRITGSGNIDVRATDSIIISNRSNTVSGMTTISSGTLLLTGNLPGGVTIDPGTTLQIGNLSAMGEVGGSIVHNGTLLLRRTSGTYAANISGSGQVVLDYGSNIYLSGSNSHTGGVHFGGPAASYYMASLHAFGSGPVTISPTAENTRIDVWLRPAEAGDFIIDNAFAFTATNSRFIVFLSGTDNHFAFTNAGEQTFLGHFIGQRGTYDMFGDTAAVLAGANTLRFDRGSTLILGSSGTTILREVTFSSGNPSGSTDPYTRIVLDADFTDPDTPEILSNFRITERLAVGTQTSIQLNHTGDIPSPVFIAPETGANILKVDDEINRNGFAVKLIDIDPEATVTYTDNSINWLADMVLRDVNGNRINAASDFDFSQDGDTIGTGHANYYIGLQNDGLYMNYGLASLSIATGKTLVLSGDTAEDNNFTAMLSGTGNVEVRATNIIKLGTYYGESTLTGTITVHTGTLGFTTPVALSPASHLELMPGSAMDMGFTNQTIGTLNAPSTTSINLHSGRLTIGTSGTLDATIYGEGIITAGAGASATLDVSGNNTGLDANWVASANATLTFHSAAAAGIGRVSGANATTSRINVQNVSGGVFESAVAGSGVFTVASSTLAMTKGVTISSFIIDSSDLTVRHPNGLNAANLTEARDSIVRIDTNSHINAAVLRLSNSSLVFVPQADGSHGNLLVENLQSPGGATLIKMNADLTKAGAGDSIIVTSGVIGDYVLDITNVAPGGKADKGVALRVVRAPEPTPMDTDPLSHFTLKDGYLEAGPYTYELIRGDESNGAFVLSDPYSYYLAVAGAHPLTRTAQSVLATAAVTGMEWHYTLDSLASRMGDLRREIEASQQTRFYNTWGRSSAYKLTAEGDIAGVPFQEDVYNFSFGADVGRRLGAGSAALLLGVYGDIGYVDRRFDNRSTGSTNSVAGGLYATWLHRSGWHLDFTFKADTRKNRFTALALDNTQARGDYTAKNITYSLELGRKINLGRSWWLEPGIQLAAASFPRSNYTTDNGIEVAIDAANATQWRAQTRIGYDNTGGRFQPYGRIAYARCDADPLTITANDNVLPHDTGFDDTRLEFGLGASYLFSRRDQLYMEYEYARADNYQRPWAFNFGFRHLW
jgi:outer membrane autotransporter protein